MTKIQQFVISFLWCDIETIPLPLVRTWSNIVSLHLASFIDVKDDGDGGDDWNYKLCKAPPKSSPPTNQHPPFLQAGCPSCRPTNSVKALMQSITFHGLAHPKLAWSLPTLSLTTVYLEGWLPYLSSALWRQYNYCLRTLGADLTSVFKRKRDRERETDRVRENWFVVLHFMQQFVFTLFQCIHICLQRLLHNQTLTTGRFHTNNTFYHSDVTKLLQLNKCRSPPTQIIGSFTEPFKCQLTHLLPHGAWQYPYITKPQS